jgi:sulfane dehydrogenase subunit SoxC
MTREETSKYTMLLPSGKAWQFFYPIDVKSVITHPSPGLAMQGAGLCQVSGLAWSGRGKISKVEVSADGGRSWAPAALQEPILPLRLLAFAVLGNGMAVRRH